MEGAVPYTPFIEILENCARVAPPASFLQAIGDAAPELATLMPELRRLFPQITPAIELPPEQQRRYLLNAYRDVVERACRVSPMVVVLEDIQWADESSLLLLRHLAQSLASVPGMILATYRDSELCGRNVAFAAGMESLIRSSAVTRTTLRRLSRGAADDLLSAMAGKQGPPPAMAKLIFSLTEGNPFFVEELVLHLAEEGRLFDSSGAWRPDTALDRIALPGSVRLVLEKRLSRFSERALRVLTTGAVIGRSFDLRLIEALENSVDEHATAEPDVLTALEEAEKAYLISSQAEGREVRYTFGHELIRQSLAERLSLPRRQRLHARIAAAIETLNNQDAEEHAATIAHHLYQASSFAEPERTIRYLLLAAKQASGAAAHEDALANVDHGLAIREGSNRSDGAHSPDIVELLTQRAGIQRSLGRAEEAIADYERAIALCESAGDLRRAAIISGPLAWVHFWKVALVGGLARMRRALMQLRERRAECDSIHDSNQDHGLNCRLTLLEALMLSMSGKAADGVAAFDRGREMQRALPGVELQAMTAQVETHLGLHIGNLDRSVVASREAETMFAATGDVWNRVDIAIFPAVKDMLCGRPAEGCCRSWHSQ